MQLVLLLRELAAALRAGDYKLAFKKFVELLNLISSTIPSPNPIPDGEFSSQSFGSLSAASAADELEALAKQLESEPSAQANGEILKKIAAIIVKLLPLLLAGL